MPVFLEVRFIGYSTHYQTLIAQSFPQGKLELDIELKSLVEELDAVSVEGKAYQDFYIPQRIFVIDFAFVDENTLLLLKNRGRYSLALINEGEDSLAHFPLSFKAEGLEKDCMEHLYVQGKDSLYSFRFGKAEITYSGAIENNYYQQKVRPCIASNAYNLYYQFHGFENQMIEYFQTPFGADESLLIRRILDEDQAYAIAEYGREARSRIGSAPSRTGDLNLQQLGRAKNAYDMMVWYERILKQAPYSPLFANAHGAVIFDYLADSVLVLDASGMLREKHFINHDEEKNFAEEILRDEATGDFYLCFQNGTATELARLSDADFRIHTRSSISYFDFPKSLKIRNGVAYFIAHDGDDYDRPKLYRQKL